VKKLILFVVAILSLCINVAKANELEIGIKAYQKGNYAQALELLRPVADQGIAEAQNYVGNTYYEGGNNITRDYKAALKWYSLAAEQGYAEAQFALGLMHVRGYGAIRDYTEVIK